MGALTQADLAFVVSRLPKDVREMMKDQGLYVGGGFIRETIAGGAVQDVDLFGPTKEKLQAAAAYLKAKREGARDLKTDNAITVVSHPRLPVQFITRWLFTNPDELVASFDFTVCQAAVWYDREARNWKSAAGDAFYSDLAARRLVYTFPVREEEAGGSMLRVRKFLQRGYTIQAASLGGVISRIAKSVDWHRVGDNETAIATVITGLLHEVDPLVVIDGVDPIDEHEVMKEVA
jgi:hypothetical protein